MKAGKKRVEKEGPAALYGTEGMVERELDLGKLCDRYGLARLDLTRLTGYSPRAVESWIGGRKTSAASMRTLRELQSLLEALEDILEPGHIGQWLRTPNEGFHGASPMQVIERGDVAQVWRMVYLLGAGQPE